MKTLVPVARSPRDVLARLLETPDLAATVQTLEPQALLHLVRTCGLEECGAIVSLATTEQLLRVFDVDLWRQDGAGAEERFDADRFAVWLEVLAEAGADVAADKLAAMDFDLVTAALGRHMLVVDPISLVTLHVGDEEPDDEALADELLARREAAMGLLDDAVSLDLGGYRVVARRGEHWDALVSILAALQERHHALLDRVLSRCAHLASEWIMDNGGLYDVLSADAQLLEDVAGDRERRRDEEGYVAPAQAVAFLKLARERHAPDARPAGLDPVTARYFRELAHEDAGRAPSPGQPAADTRAPLDRLLPQRSAGGAQRLGRIHALLLSAREDEALYGRRTQELAFLANVLVAGCSFSGRRFRAVEAAEAALALCNLGLEIEGESAAEAGAVLVAAFRVGWNAAHHEVGMFVADRLAAVLETLRCPERELRRDVRRLGARLRVEMGAGAPWRAREELDVLLLLDQPSWAILAGLLDECPVLPTLDQLTGAKRLSPRFEFLSERRQIAWVREFLESLPERLASGG